MGRTLRKALMLPPPGVGRKQYDMSGARPVAVSVPIRAGFTTVTVEVIGYGEPGQCGGYSRKNTYPLAGLTALYLHVPNDDSGVYVRENSISGTIIAKARFLSSVGVGDVKYSGNASVPAGHSGNNSGDGWLNSPPSGTGFGYSATTAGTAGGVMLRWNL